jgi:hypothetical protein
MHEFLLKLRSETVEKDKYVSVKPAGSVIEAATFHRKRQKWMEIFADLVDPRPRKGRHGHTLPSKRSMNEAGLILRIGRDAYDVLCENWRPSLHEHWFHVDRLVENEMREKEIARTLFWDQEIEKVSGLRDAMGREPTGTADLIDCQPWGPYARKNCLIVVNSDMESSEAAAMEGTVDSETVGGIRITRPAAHLRWEQDLGLTQAQRDRIRSPNYVVHPRFDEARPKVLFRSCETAPEIEQVRARLRARGRPA